MPMISGTHHCTKCNNEMYWEYHLPDLLSNASVCTYTNGSHKVRLLNDFRSKQLEFRIVCTKCNHTEDFTYDNHNYYNGQKWR